MSLDKLVLSSGSEQILLSISPDWPSIIVTGAIGIGSIFTSIAVVVISRRNQKSQSREKVAQLRQEWLSELRETMSQFVAVAVIITVRVKFVENYVATTEGKEDYQALLHYRSKIHLMIDANKEYSLVLKSLISDVVKIIGDSDENSISDAAGYIKAFEEQSQGVLEKAWKDIRNDLKL
ncbi:hypothetical protein [Vibrio cholerae]|uniref:hypothetical protein n=1 Tax=Vibrio cholerae TaxID=666 RepID=UPI003729F658|nr:hypothetical protein [Vibrio cholerae]